jgi:hypothetical protein
MKHFVIVLFVAINLPYFAQVQITRDPIACAYGLKNEQNKWIVPAEYQQLLLLDPGIYACQMGEKWGILRANGKKVLATKYDNVSVFATGKYLVSERIQTANQSIQKVGVIDSTGSWFLPQEFASISRMENEHYMLVKANVSSQSSVRYQSTIADAKGNKLFPYLDGVLLARFRLLDLHLLGDGLIGSFTVAGNVRLVNSYGEFVSDSTFDMGMSCGENFIVTKNGRYGLVNSEGKIIVYPKYHFERENRDYNNPLSCLHSDHQFVFIEGGKHGILNGSWKEIVPPEYDRITPLNSNSFRFAKGRYLAYQEDKKKYHLLDGEGSVLAKIDTLTLRMLPIPKKDYYAMQEYNVYYIFGERKGQDFRYGILDGDGSILLQAEYSSLIFNDNDELVLLTHHLGAEIPKGYTISLKSAVLGDKVTLHFIQKIGDVYLFGSGEKIYALSYSEACNCWTQSLYGANNPQRYGDYTIMNGASDGFIFDHKNNTTEKVKFVDRYSGSFVLVQRNDGFNLLHPTKGFLFKQSMYQLNQQFASINRIWAQGQNGKWKIYDTLGNPRLIEDFDAISYFWDTMIVQMNYKKGILDEACNWILTPSFNDINQITKQHYVGVTSSGKVGIINLRQPALIDSSFTSFRPIYQNPALKKFYYCLEKNGQAFFFDNDGIQLQTAEKELVSQYWTTPEQRGANFYIDCLPEEVGYLQTHKDLVYNFFYPFYQQNVLLDQRSITNGIKGSGGVGSYSFKALNASYNKLSLLASQSIRGTVETDDMKYRDIYRKSEDRDFEVVNYFLSDGKWRDVVFNQLFNTRDNNYQNVIIEAIQNSPNIRIDCNNPIALYEGATHFTFSKNGITLYFFEGQAQAFQLILSKEQLAKIPSARWILAWM